MSDIFVNDVLLTGGVWSKVESTTGTLAAAPLRSGGIQIPGVHGEAPAALMLYGPGTVTLPVRVFGVDRSTGVQVGDGVEQLEANLRYLSALVHESTVTVDHVYSEDFVKRATCRVRTDPFVAERVYSNPPTALATVSLSISSGFWRDRDPITSPTYELSTGEEQELPDFAKADGPMDDLIIRIGPCANPRIYHDNDSIVFGYDGVIPSGCTLGVDVANNDILTYSTGSWTPNVRLIRYVPFARWFQLNGGPEDVNPTVRFTHTGGGTASLSFEGRRAFRTG